MLFKTKEMYNELQVSITQLYLRQQIQKGVFDGALRSVEELALAVRNEKQKVRELEERIIRDVLQVAREKEIEAQLRRIDEQLLEGAGSLSGAGPSGQRDAGRSAQRTNHP
jgi:hypothetical protein